MKKLAILCCFMSVGVYGQSQIAAEIDSGAHNYNIGLEYEYYPAGQIFGLVGEYFINNEHALHAKLGANVARRKDFSGLNDDERGWGPGFTLGYRYYFDGTMKNFYVGLRADMWSMDIDWKDSTNSPTSGTTEILVFQPTAEFGYSLNFGVNKMWNFKAAIVNGLEINVVSNGKDVGQGFITLGQITVARRIFTGHPSFFE